MTMTTERLFIIAEGVASFPAADGVDKSPRGVEGVVVGV